MVTNNAWNSQDPAQVAKGGTGVASTTAYAVICGGTTSTNPLQSIAGVGTSGQILTSNGAGALPTFQNNGGGGTSGVTIQRVFTTTAATGSTSSQIPFDNTTPQNTEGAEVITLAITPTSASSILEISGALNISSTTDNCAFALFQDSTANAKATFPALSCDVELSNNSFLYRMTAGTTSSTTFKIRLGPSTLGGTGTAYWNTGVGTAKYNSTLFSWMAISELNA